MTTISHKNLTGAQLHELKGVSTATTGQVATASGGATVWQKLTATNLTGSGNPFGGQLFHVRDQRTNGTAGTTWTGSTWTTQVLQTTKTNEISSASLSSNQVSLPTGTYRVYGTAKQNVSSANGSINVKVRLRNITAGTTITTGMSNSGGVGGGAAGAFGLAANLQDTFTIAGTTTIELQGWASGSGITSPGSTSSGEVEVYAELMFWKIA